MVNKVILIGNLGKDPEMSYTPSGVAVTKATLATNERWTTESGERRDRTEWHNLVFWKRQAEIANEYLRKGSKIYLEGRITYRTWEGQDGQKRNATDIIVQNFQILTPRGEGGAAGGERPAGGGQRREPQGERPSGERQGGARQRTRQPQPSEEPHYEPYEQGGDTGNGGRESGGQESGGNFGASDDDDLPF